MRINIFRSYDLPYIHSLVWSHNGTVLTFDGRVIVGNNGKSLTISNMVQSDAGIYEVKINSTYFDNLGRICAEVVLPNI